MINASTRLAGFVCVGVLLVAGDAAAQLTGFWNFDVASNLGLASVGNDLGLTGTATSVSGISGPDGAAEVGDGSYFTVTHGINPNGGGSFVNQYTLLMDISVPASSAGNWLSLYQTNTSNTNDGDLFIRDTDQAIGLAALGGYSSRTMAPDTWYRVVLSVANGTQRSVYVDGELWLNGNAGAIDDRHSLDPLFHVFADENGDEDPVRISNLAVWGETLDAATIAALGGANPAGIISPPPGRLTLRVDAGSGQTEIINESGHEVSLAGYSIRSAGAHLAGVDGRWESLADQSVAGWSETSVASDRLAETSGIALPVADGVELPLGTPYDFRPTEFGVSPAGDVEFAYDVAGVGTIPGTVEMSGNPNTLTLTIDPATGEGMIRNTSAFSVAINGYGIRSRDGAFVPGHGAWEDWGILSDLAPDEWDPANAASEHVSELSPLGRLRIEPGVAIHLGTMFDVSQTDDELSFVFQRYDDRRAFDGTVRFDTVAEALVGDFNGDGMRDARDIDLLSVEVAADEDNPLFDLTADGAVDDRDRDEMIVGLIGTVPGDANLDYVVDAADLGLWRDHVFGEGTGWRSGDFNGDGVTDGRDFNLWYVYRGFDASALTSPVPEPASWWMVVVAGCWGFRRVTHRHVTVGRGTRRNWAMRYRRGLIFELERRC